MGCLPIALEMIWKSADNPCPTRSPSLELCCAFAMGIAFTLTALLLWQGGLNSDENGEVRGGQNDSLQLSRKSQQTREAHQNALRKLADLLPRKHPSHHPLDDEIAARWFQEFLGVLDPRRIYLTSDDIQRFARYRSRLDDQARRGDLSFPDLVRKTYRKRLRQANETGIDWLQKTHALESDERFVPFPKEYVADESELMLRWKRRVLFDLLEEQSSGLSKDRAVKKLRERYQRVLKQNRFCSDEELYEVFLDTFAKSFGPHNGYFGETTLDRFRR